MATKRILRQRKRVARIRRQRVVLRLLGIDVSRYEQRVVNWMFRCHARNTMDSDIVGLPPSYVRIEDLAMIQRSLRVNVEQGT